MIHWIDSNEIPRPNVGPDMMFTLQGECLGVFTPDGATWKDPMALAQAVQPFAQIVFVDESRLYAHFFTESPMETMAALYAFCHEYVETTADC